MEVADLVEEDGPAVGRLELADLELVRAGEGPALVPEELAFEQLPRDRRAVDLDERAALPDRLLVDRAGHHVLAGAGLAHDEDGDVDLRGLLDDLADLAHLGAAPQADFRAQAGAGLVVGRVLPVPARAGERALEDVLQILRAERLLEKIVRAERGRLGGQVARVRIREQDDRPGHAPLGLEAAQEIIRLRAEVEQAEDEAALGDLGERVLGRGGHDRFVSPLTQELDEVMRAASGSRRR